MLRASDEYWQYQQVYARGIDLLDLLYEEPGTNIQEVSLIEEVVANVLEVLDAIEQEHVR